MGGVQSLQEGLGKDPGGGHLSGWCREWSILIEVANCEAALCLIMALVPQETTGLFTSHFWETTATSGTQKEQLQREANASPCWAWEMGHCQLESLLLGCLSLDSAQYLSPDLSLHTLSCPSLCLPAVPPADICCVTFGKCCPSLGLKPPLFSFEVYNWVLSAAFSTLQSWFCACQF